MARSSKVEKEAERLSAELTTLTEELRQVVSQYEARLLHEIEEVRTRVRAASEQGGDGPRAELFSEMVHELRRLQLKPNKGRRKDLRRIDRLVGDLTARLDSW